MFNCSPAKSHKLHRSFSWTAEEKFSRRALDCSYVSAGLVRTCAVIISNCSHASHVVLVSCISVCEFNSLAWLDCIDFCCRGHFAHCRFNWRHVIFQLKIENRELAVSNSTWHRFKGCLCTLLFFKIRIRSFSRLWSMLMFAKRPCHQNFWFFLRFPNPHDLTLKDLDSEMISMTLFLWLFTYLPIYLSICLSIYRSIYLFTYLSIYLSFICLSVYLSTCLSVYLSICLSVYLSICGAVSFSVV